ncbi:MAG: hypothetical protein IJK83_05155 [Clostridiales bacterium]|nr:hypothetical protein [Lachnospiraceae bacterium]MBQ6303394.1 hypothetical protein [Clostridiales bacterium]
MTSCSRLETFISEPTTVVASESTTSASTIIDTVIEQSEENATTQTESSEMETVMVLRINDQVIGVEWEDNESVESLKELAAKGTITIDMSMYGGFEQVGPIGSTLPSNDEQITTESGDIVLYSGNQIVFFYGSNSWAYTRLGKVQDMSASELEGLLGNGDVTLTITIE